MTSNYVRPGEGRHYPMIDGDHVVKAAVHDDAGGFEVFEVQAASGPAAPPHVSPWTGVLYLLEGGITAYVGGEEYDVHPGGLVVFPAGQPSTFEVTDEPARFLAITTGARAGRFFADFASTVPTDRPIEEAIPDVLSVTQRHGVTNRVDLSSAHPSHPGPMFRIHR